MRSSATIAPGTFAPPGEAETDELDALVANGTIGGQSSPWSECVRSPPIWWWLCPRFEPRLEAAFRAFRTKFPSRIIGVGVGVALAVLWAVLYIILSASSAALVYVAQLYALLLLLLAALHRQDVLQRRHFVGALGAARAAAHQRRSLEAALAEAREELRAMSAAYDEVQSLGRDLVRRGEYTGSETGREEMITQPPSVMLASADHGMPDRVLVQALRGATASQEAAARAARLIRTPQYTLRHFLDDMLLACPELALYLVVREAGPDGKGVGPETTSGTTPVDEYRRTVGALFAVYWLMRIGLDGERGFCFGVDEAWTPRHRPAAADGGGAAGAAKGFGAMSDDEKRRAFYDQQEWATLQQLCVDAGMLRRDEHGELSVDVERTVAMLVLTAVHDVMKVEALLPVVESRHAPYCGFKRGDLINDHDVALGYVLDHHGELLPSFARLPPRQQRAVRFTQAKMAFNHGWLVQAEAPPAALFSRFKTVIAEGGVDGADVAFYFVHWLTDLAGAVPTPLEGSEKFVLKFPHPVLASFIRSFGVLNELAHKSEAAVFEEYLVRCWGDAQPKLGPLPVGAHAISLMRLVVQAQAADKQAALLQAFELLTSSDRSVLAIEMARTGLHGQAYDRSPVGAKGGEQHGPAFLVYYSPAFVRALSPQSTLEALQLLAEVYRRARELWPLGACEPGAPSSVTVRIDQIKELSLLEIQAVYSSGDAWLLCRRNDLEAVVERHQLDAMQALIENGVAVTTLKFWKRAKGAGGGGGSSLTSSNANSRPASTHGDEPGGALAVSPAAERRAPPDTPASASPGSATRVEPVHEGETLDERRGS